MVTAAVAKRKAEFATVRYCARQALLRLGYAPQPILSGSCREPLWPPGVVGSLSHCENYRAAAVAPATGTLALGIDVEKNLPLPSGVLSLIAGESELRLLRQLELTAPGPAWDRLLFSAKESLYKAWYPLLSMFYKPAGFLEQGSFPGPGAADSDFKSWEVTFFQMPAGAEERNGFSSGSFVGTISNTALEKLTAPVFTAPPRNRAIPERLAPVRFPGRWMVCDQHILTAVHLGRN